jgi:3-methylcrotonyl-CoA carboxylase alpha subunit
MLRSLLVANRGEIARRIFGTARRLGIHTVAVTTEADSTWPHWREADTAVSIGDGPAADSYLSIERIVAAAVASGVEAIHPGYGFLSENAAFAEAAAAAGLIFVGPPPAAIRSMGSKSDAKRLMALAGVPVVPGYGGERQDPYFLKQKAYEIGYPVLIKAVAGGGGRGMRRVAKVIDFDDALASARREALSAFGDDQVLLERYVDTPRHIEVQIFADRHGNIVHLFERDCSVQRRHQKVIEEAPAPGLSDEARRALGEMAVRAAAAVGYEGAGTVEFVADASRALAADSFFFIEMNTRLQVEHPVTEAVTGIDLVEWQLRVASGEPLPRRQEEIAFSGHAIEARLYAEDPGADFRPSTGRLVTLSLPSGPGLRIDSGVEEGTIVGPYYDAMLAKVIASGADRREAVARLADALTRIRIAGPKTNLAFLAAIVADPEFRAGGVDTGFIDRALPRLRGDPLGAALAAAAIGEWAAREAGDYASGSPGPWSRTDAFELTGVRRHSVVSVEIDGAPVVASLAWSKDGPTVVTLGGEEPAYAAELETVWGEREALVLRGGRQLRVAFPDLLSRDLETAGAGGEIAAPISGRVVEVSVVTGAEVARGDPLFSIEAMKMEHGVTAPRAGTVKAVRVAPGQQIAEGTVVVVIEAEE